MVSGCMHQEPKKENRLTSGGVFPGSFVSRYHNLAHRIFRSKAPWLSPMPGCRDQPTADPLLMLGPILRKSRSAVKQFCTLSSQSDSRKGSESHNNRLMLKSAKKARRLGHLPQGKHTGSLFDKVACRLTIESSQMPKLDWIDPPLAGFKLRDKGLRLPQALGDIDLVKTGL